MSKILRLISWSLMAIWILQAAACAPASATAEPTQAAPTAEKAISAPTLAPKPTKRPPRPTRTTPLLPGDPPEAERTLEDSDSSIRAYENRTLSGDNFLENLYERPFTSQEMIYQPDLDIYTVGISADDDFFYFTITFNARKVEKRGIFGIYGIEFDRTKTGRGDLLVLAGHVQKEWTIKNVRVLADSNVDVGGPTPMLSDEGFNGNGYDTLVKLGGDKVAFARVSPDDSDAVQIAVSRALLEDAEEFLWGAWVDSGKKDPKAFDYNDSMSLSQAGSPLKDDANYPIQDLFSVDNNLPPTLWL